MTWFELGYAIFAILFAWLNAYLIKKGKRIYHALNGLLHLAAAIYCGWQWWWPSVLIILCNTRILFDSFLSIFRKLPWLYSNPKGKSWFDRLEAKIFGNDVLEARIVYFCTSVLLNCIYFVFIHD